MIGVTKKMKVAIVGSRHFPNLDWVKQFVDHLKPDDVVISGTEPGDRAPEQIDDVDRIAIYWARRRGLQTIVVPAEWDKYGRSAGIMRNPLIIAQADTVVAFWDGASRGTWNSMQHAKNMNKRIRVILPDGQVLKEAPTEPASKTMARKAKADAG